MYPVLMVSQYYVTTLALSCICSSIYISTHPSVYFIIIYLIIFYAFQSYLRHQYTSP